MPRRPRIVIEGLPHHITQRGNNKQKIFFDDNDYDKYLARFEEYRCKNHLSVISFCLMPNHVHFIVIPKEADSLSFTFHFTHLRYAQYFNIKYSRCGHVWQGRYFSCPVNTNQILKVIKYVEMNPLRAGLVKKIADWEWSSVPCHISGRKPKIILDSIPEIIPQAPEFWKELLKDQEEANFIEAIRKYTRSGKLFEGKLIEQ